MTDSHAQLEAWLVDGAMVDPPREIAVHATLCESCTARLGAFDALALIDVAAAGSPPPQAAPSRVRMGVAWARLGSAVLGTVVAGIILVFGASQLLGLVAPGGGPDATDVVGLISPSDGGETARSQDPMSPGPEQAGTAAPVASATPQPGVIPGPLPSLPPGATPGPTPSTPQPSVGATPTPAPPDPTPTPPAPTPTPTPATVPGAPSLTGSAASGPVELLWSVPPDGGDPITGYNIYRSLDGSGWALLQAAWAGNAYTDSTVAPATPYWYYVTALNGIGESGPSNIEAVTTP